VTFKDGPNANRDPNNFVGNGPAISSAELVPLWSTISAFWT